MCEAEASQLILMMVGNYHEVEKCDSNCWKNEKIALRLCHKQLKMIVKASNVGVIISQKETKWENCEGN